MKFREKIYGFFFAPATAHPLAALRIGLTGCLLIQSYFVAPIIFDLYGENGILQGKLIDFYAGPIPNINGLLDFGVSKGLTEHFALQAIGLTYLVALVSMFAGFQTRIASVVTFLTHLLLTQGHTTAYGADTFAHFLLFYLMWLPSGEVWSVDAWRNGPAAPKSTTRFGLRIVQLHLAIAYCASGIEKSMGPMWWDGEAIWRSLMLPIYNQMPMAWVSEVPWLAKIAGWGTLLIEGAYPLFIFWPRTRKLWVALVVSLHAGIAIFLGLHIFALVMGVLTPALFAVSPEPRSASRPAPALKLFRGRARAETLQTAS